MTIQTFIEKAIEGGYRSDYLSETGNLSTFVRIETILLDPEAWKAVGKVEGWEERVGVNDRNGMLIDAWLYYMHRMIDALAEGKTIEQYLETL